MSAGSVSKSKRLLNNVSFVLMLSGLPLLVWFSQISVLHYDGAPAFRDASFWRHAAKLELVVLAVYLGWLLFQAGMYHFLPGATEAGQPLEDGSRLNYTLNGLTSFVATTALWLALHFFGIVPGTWIYRHLGELFVAANVVVFPLCAYFFFLGRSQAADTERHSNVLEAFFVGAARNPRNGTLDWKFFCESRPGLTLWVLVAWSSAIHQYERFGFISNAMVLTCFFITLYIVDYYVHEDAILTTWDIVHEPFGWMLCWGSLVYVPFFYPLAAVWLAERPYVLPAWAVFAILVMGITGYVIFRQSNIQKHRFRKNPHTRIWGQAPAYIQTRRGTKLLTSGWWGVASHANYLGDLLLSLAMCAVVGTGTVFGYSYFLSFVPLLIHRDWRDDRHCAAKYGEDWTAYRKKVRWHILPGVY